MVKFALLFLVCLGELCNSFLCSFELAFVELHDAKFYVADDDILVFVFHVLSGTLDGHLGDLSSREEIEK